MSKTESEAGEFRRPYESPKVTVYGDVRELTRSTTHAGRARTDTVGFGANRNTV